MASNISSMQLDDELSQILTIVFSIRIIILNGLDIKQKKHTVAVLYSSDQPV